jgi:hypothetical protein
VAHPPLPLQEFFPLQPLSPVLQPPLPLQEFWPLQACLSFLALVSAEAYTPADIFAPELLEAGAAFKRDIVPPSSPVMAAVITSELLLTFIDDSPCCGI